MANHQFPDWVSSGIIFRNFFVEKFGAYVHCIYDRERDHISFDYIPKESYTKIPPKAKEKFSKIWFSFVSWLSEELGTIQIISSYAHIPISLEVVEDIRRDINKAISEYETRNQISLKEILGICLGHEPSDLLPIPKLKAMMKQIEEEDKRKEPN